MRILLVEDDTRIAANIVEFLSAEAFAVDHVIDGKMGYEMATGNVAYDVIVSDRMLP
jgi:DNA-binding response OmpR family regulator